MKALSFFLYTIPGAPTTFYGDEAGATNEGEFGCNKDRPITDDPFMRVPFHGVRKILTFRSGIRT